MVECDTAAGVLRGQHGAARPAQRAQGVARSFAQGLTMTSLPMTPREPMWA